MIEFDEQGNKLVLKLVYYGPALSGKTTNLLCLHDQLAPEGRGDLMTLDTRNDRTIFFDLLPFFLVAPSGLKIKVKVFTVPGQVRHDATRKAVLQRADGVAFIADSQTAEAANNAESFANLEQNLAFVGLDIEQVPLIVQYNKRDLAGIVPEEQVRSRWSSTGIPVFLASAVRGDGIVETFTELASRMFDAVNRKLLLTERHRLTRDAFLMHLVARGKDNAFHGT